MQTNVQRHGRQEETRKGGKKGFQKGKRKFGTDDMLIISIITMVSQMCI